MFLVYNFIENGHNPFSISIRLRIMNKLFFFLLFLTPVLTYAQERKNVSVAIEVDSFIGEVSQVAYIYHYDQNEIYLDDSVIIYPNIKKYHLSAYAPYETDLHLLFSKRGPINMKILASPFDEIELAITQEDNRVGTIYKKLYKGSLKNDSLVCFWDRIYQYANKRIRYEDSLSHVGIPESRKEIIRDSIKKCKTEESAYLIDVINSTSSPSIAHSSLVLIQDEIGEKDYKTYLGSLYHRFPYYPPIYNKYLGNKIEPPSKQSLANRLHIRTLERNRLSFMETGITEPDSVRIGEIINIAMTDSLGKKVCTDSFLDKYVLVEVWASWCYPCLREMPNIIYAQHQFTKDLICCAITIDKDDTAWLKCINKEGLQDLKHYKASNNEGIIYNDIKRIIFDGTIPKNCLIDRKGRIIAKNIYGKKLIEKLYDLTK